MGFRILGPLQAFGDGREIPIRRRKQRLLLAMLLVARGRVVPTDRLIAGLWADDPPETAVKALQTYVSQLRALLDPGRNPRGPGRNPRGPGRSPRGPGELLVTGHSGYRLRAGDAEVDAVRFEGLVARGTELARTDPAAARDSFAEGLRLWRGPALDGCAGAAFAEAEATRLEELRLSAVERRIAADLVLGRDALVVAELRELVRHHPLRETLWEHLMVALYRGGRQGEALRAYQDARRSLGEQLGLAPGPALERIQRRILAQDPALAPAHDAGPVALVEPVAPAPEERAEPGGSGRTERRRATAIHVALRGSPATPPADRPADPPVDPTAGPTAGAFAGPVAGQPADSLLGALRREVSRYGGTVIEAAGGALSAVFGAPVTHEDDPERAVRASLAIRDRVLGRAGPAGGGMRVGVRVGVDTGEVHAGAPGAGPWVSGAALAGAARLAGRAAAGEVLAGAATYEATRDAVRYAAVRDPDAVRDLWQVVEVAEQPSRRPISTTPLVGRAAELRILNAVWERVRDARCPQLVTISGPPGIGKSRLVGELAAGFAGATVLRSRCLPYGDAVFGPLAQLIRQIVGVSESDPIRTVRRRLLDWLEAHLPPPEMGRVDEYLVMVLSLLGDIIEQRRSTGLLLRRFVEVVAADRPTVLVLDDVHWAHAGTLDAIETLAARVRSVPLLIVAVGRPELYAARPGWGGGLPAHTALALEALPAEQSRELARLLLDRRLAAAEAGAIEAAAGGNPLFLEELAAWIGEGHRVSADLPATVRAVIGARLDTLPAAERRVIVDAAAVGHTFWPGVLAHLGAAPADELAEILDDLEMRGLVVRRPEASIGDDAGLAFRHDLISETAYDLIPPAERADRHLSIARYLAGAYPRGPAPAVVAHHWMAAGDIDRAVACLVEAAEQANSGWERDRAVALYQQAMDLIGDADPERRRVINLRRAVALTAWAHGVMDVVPPA